MQISDHFVLPYLRCEHPIQEPQASKFRPENRYEKGCDNTPENKMESQASIPKQLSTKGSNIISKSVKILCRPGVSKSSPRVSKSIKIISQGVKMQAPSSRNGNREELNRAGGRGRSP